MTPPHLLDLHFEPGGAATGPGLILTPHPGGLRAHLHAGQPHTRLVDPVEASELISDLLGSDLLWRHHRTAQKTLIPSGPPFTPVQASALRATCAADQATWTCTHAPDHLRVTPRGVDSAHYTYAAVISGVEFSVSHGALHAMLLNLLPLTTALLA